MGVTSHIALSESFSYTAYTADLLRIIAHRMTLKITHVDIKGREDLLSAKAELRLFGHCLQKGSLAHGLLSLIVIIANY